MLEDNNIGRAPDQRFTVDPAVAVFVAGHRGMVGAAIVRKLEGLGCRNIITRTRRELDLTNQLAVSQFIKNTHIDSVILAAAKVGGIHANNAYPAEFIHTNLTIQGNVINAAYKSGIKKLLFLGSSCIYPKLAPQPLKEEHLLTGLLEQTNEPYAIAKIAGIKMCEAYNRQYGTEYRAVMPTNLYGPGDNYHLENSHVIPAMIRKYHLAKLAQEGDVEGINRDEQVNGSIPDDVKSAIGYTLESGVPVLSGIIPKVILWGTGEPYREFLHVDDMAEACIFVMSMQQKDFKQSAPGGFVNVGTGKDLKISQVAKLIQNAVGYEGETVYNTEQPDGTPRKLMDTSKLNNMGWAAQIGLSAGLLNAYKWYLEQQGL